MASQVRLLTVLQLTREQPGFSEHSLRWLLFKANENGLAKSGAIKRNGRRVLIDEIKFLEWVDSRQSYHGGAGCDSAGPVAMAAQNKALPMR